MEEINKSLKRSKEGQEKSDQMGGGNRSRLENWNRNTQTEGILEMTTHHRLCPVPDEIRYRNLQSSTGSSSKWPFEHIVKELYSKEGLSTYIKLENSQINSLITHERVSRTTIRKSNQKPGVKLMK